MNTKINKILTIITITIIFISIIVFVSLTKSTYSLSDKYVVFKGVGSHDGEILKSCKIGTDGKLESSCVDEIGNICRRWSKSKLPGYWEECDSDTGTCCRENPGNKVATNDLKSMTFSQDEVYYCVGCSSYASGYSWGCYICDSDSSIMKWGINGAPTDANCTGNKWHKDSSITDDKKCPPPAEKACYECKADKTIVDWRTSDDGDNQCSGGYKKLEGVTQANCKYVAPEPTYACYECKNDKTIVEWLTSGDADNKCSGGYRELAGKTKAQCKYVAPEPTKACYECEADKNIVEWRTSALGDNKCPGGYNKTTKTESQCKPVIPDNPKTGSTAIILTWIIASIAIGCSLWYLKNDALSK